MASVTLKLSSVRNKDNGKSEVLLRYRNTRTIALRAHTHVYVLPKFFQDGEIVIKNRLMTKEVQEAQEAKTTLDRIVNHVLDKGTGKAIEDFTLDWAQDVIDRLLYPENYKDSASDELFFQDKTADFLKFKKISYERHKSYRCIFDIVQRFELYTGKPINMGKATGDTLVNLEKFFKDEHTFFEPKKEKYRTILVPTKKYKFVWDNSHHERAPQKRSDNAIVTYTFFKIQPKDIPMYSQTGLVGTIPFVRYFHSILAGKAYKEQDDANEIYLAFERTPQGERDSAEVLDEIKYAVEDQAALSHPIELKPNTTNTKHGSMD